MLDPIDRFAKSALGRKLAADQAREDLEARRALVDRLAELRGQLAIEAPPLEDAEHQAAARVADVERQWVDARTAVAEAQRRRWTVTEELQRQIASVERQLDASAPAAIDAFLRELLDEVDRVRAQYATTGETRDRFGNIGPARSNSASIDRRLQGIAQARVAAQELKHAALTEAEVDERIAALWAGLPEVSFEDPI